MPTSEPPRYDELPLLEPGTNYRHAWDFFPPGDNLGCLANITAAARRDAISTVSEGRVINLCLPLNEPDPPLFGRKGYTHTIFSTGRNNLDDRLDNFYPQGSTQWDGFRHVRAREFGFFTGVRDEFSASDDRLGVSHWADQGIIGRGMLLDFSDRYLGRESDRDHTIGVDLLRERVEAIGIRRGDVLCIRTGWVREYRSSTIEQRAHLATDNRWPGLEGSAGVAELLWDWGVAAVTADNPAVEVAPGSPAIGSLHRRVLPLLGMPLGELFDFESLAAECARLGRHTFLFAAIPLNLPGGVGSPGNAVAVL